MSDNTNIVEEGYTQGHQFLLPDGQSYKGYYYKDIKGVYWSGERPNKYSSNCQTQKKASVRLTNLITNNIKLDNNFFNKYNYISGPFTKLYNKESDEFPLLKNDIIQPTDCDYKNGYFKRYVAQLKACTKPEDNIVELSQETFNIISQNQNVNKYYIFAIFNWKLSGPMYDVYENNIRIKAGIIDSNLRSLLDVEKKAIIGLTLFLFDPLQFVIKYPYSESVIQDLEAAPSGSKSLIKKVSRFKDKYKSIPKSKYQVPPKDKIRFNRGNWTFDV